MSTADAVAREAAWLTTSGDGLPALLRAAGGPWDNVQAYYPRTPAVEQRSIYVLRRRIVQTRFANQRIMANHQVRLRLWWPVLSVDGSAEQEQAAFDAAIDLVLVRVSGPLLDKTHGGRFLSVAENPKQVEVDFHDPLETVPTLGGLLAEIGYAADDPEINA